MARTQQEKKAGAKIQKGRPSGGRACSPHHIPIGPKRSLKKSTKARTLGWQKAGMGITRVGGAVLGHEVGQVDITARACVEFPLFDLA